MEEKKRLILKLVSKFFTVFVISFIIFMILFIKMYSDLSFNYLLLFSLIASGIMGFSYTMRNYDRDIDRLMELLVFKNLGTYRSDDKYKEYIRQLPGDYGPAIVSVLLDYEIEYEKDIAATILNLHAKKYIKISANGLFKDIVVIKDDVTGLQSHEVYVYECIKSKSMIENEVFEDRIKNDAYSLGLLFTKREMYKKNLIILLIIILISAIVYIYGEFFMPFHNINILGFAIGFQILKILDYVFIISYLTYLGKVSKREYARTTFGRKQANLWLRLRSFLNDFSQLDKSSLMQIDIWDAYLAYALGMGIIKKEDDFTKINPDIKFRYENINIKDMFNIDKKI
jgi:uncharacterized membrane protein